MAAVQLGAPWGDQPDPNRSKQVGGYGLFLLVHQQASRAGKRASRQAVSTIARWVRWDRDGGRPQVCRPVSKDGRLELPVNTSLHHRESLHRRDRRLPHLRPATESSNLRFWKLVEPWATRRETSQLDATLASPPCSRCSRAKLGTNAAGKANATARPCLAAREENIWDAAVLRYREDMR